MREFPNAYRDLSFDAKIFYSSKYDENVWSRTLAYSDGSPAAVGLDNKPLQNHLVLDSAGNIVSYRGRTLHDMKTFGFSTEGSWEEQQAKLEEIKRFTRKLLIKETTELSRVHGRQKYENHQKTKARVKKMQEGLEKLRKASQLKNEEAVEDAAMEITQEFNESS